MPGNRVIPLSWCGRKVIIEGPDGSSRAQIRMKYLSTLAILVAVICCIVPNVVRVEEEVDYYKLAVLRVIAGILARIDARMEKLDP